MPASKKVENLKTWQKLYFATLFFIQQPHNPVKKVRELPTGYKCVEKSLFKFKKKASAFQCLFEQKHFPGKSLEVEKQ